MSYVGDSAFSRRGCHHSSSLSSGDTVGGESASRREKERFTSGLVEAPETDTLSVAREYTTKRKTCQAFFSLPRREMTPKSA